MMMKYLTPRFVLKWVWLWPPYLTSAISVKKVNKEFNEVIVQMKQRIYNTNYVGVHFGGSLYSMCDPFFMFILLHHLKDEHIVWDQAAEIVFLKPAKGKVEARFYIAMEEIEKIKEQAKNEYRLKPVFHADVLDERGHIVAQVKKTLYVRRKDAVRSSS